MAAERETRTLPAHKIGCRWRLELSVECARLIEAGKKVAVS